MFSGNGEMARNTVLFSVSNGKVHGKAVRLGGYLQAERMKVVVQMQSLGEAAFWQQSMGKILLLRMRSIPSWFNKTFRIPENLMTGSSSQIVFIR